MPDHSTTIIDRDIEFYGGEVERANDALFRCFPKDEARHMERRNAAEAVVLALMEYKKVLYSANAPVPTAHKVR